MNEEENIFHFLLGRNLFIFCFVIENRPTHTHRRWLPKKKKRKSVDGFERYRSNPPCFEGGFPPFLSIFYDDDDYIGLL